MNFIKLDSNKLFEAIENVGNKKAEEWGDTYKDEVAIFPEAVMPVSYVEAVEEVKRWREKANKAVEERRKLALEAVEADDEDRFKNMSAKDKKFNKGEKISLDESLMESLTEEVVKVSDKADEFLIKLSLAGFHDWQQLALDLLDSMSDDQVEKFIDDYSYEVETPGIYFEKEEPVTESLKEELITPETINDFKPWNGAVPNWERIQNEGKLEEFKNLIAELYPDNIEDQKLNDLLWYDFDFIKEVLNMQDEEEEVQEEGDIE